MDIRQLRAFVAVVEEGSIHAGARSLCTAQPALSTTLRRLERELGTTLLTRSAQGVQTTPAGAQLYARAREIVTRVDRLAQTTERTSSAERSLRVGLLCGLVAAGELTGPIVSTYRRRHPDTHVEVVELTIGDHLDALLEGRVDVALVRPPYYADPIGLAPLFVEPVVLCVNRSHPLADADGVHVDDLHDERFVQLVNTPPHWMDFWHLTSLRDGAGPARPDAAVTLAELQLTVLTEDVSQPVAGAAWRGALSSPLLREVPILDAPGSTVAVGWRHDDPHDDIVEFTECARQVCDELLALVPDAQPIAHVPA